MPILEWNDEFSVYNNEFDDHHKRLLELLNKTYDEFICGADNDSLLPILEEMLKYAEHHFSAEEQWMEQHNYPRLGKHRGEHEYFIGRVSAMHQEFLNGHKTMSLEVLTFLKSWLSTHILGSDAGYSQFILANELK